VTVRNAILKLGLPWNGAGRSRAFDEAAFERLRLALEARPDATPEELRDAAGVRCCVGTVKNALLRLAWERTRDGRPPGMVA
jgi:hypothetical protein